MKKNRKFKIQIFILVLVLIIKLTPFQVFAEDKIEVPIVNSEKYLVVEDNSHTPVAESQADEVLKSDLAVSMLAVATALDKIKTDDVALVEDSAVKIFEKYSVTYPSNLIGVKKGENIKVSDLISTILLINSQDSMSVLVSASYGNESDFLNAMNQKADELELKNTLVGNLYIQESTSNSTSLRDLSKLMSYLTFKSDVVRALNTREIIIPANNLNPSARNYKIENPMLDNGSDKYYENLQFSLSGKSSDSKLIFLSFSEKVGKRFITAIEGNSDINLNYSDTKILSDWAFNNFKSQKLISKNTQLSKYELPNKETIPLVTQNDFYILRNQSDTTNINDFSTKIKLNPIEKAVINTGDILGTAEIIAGGKSLGIVNLVSNTNVDLSNGNYTNSQNKDSFFKNFFTTLLLSILILALTVFIIITTRNIVKSNKKQKELKLKREEYRKRRRSRIDLKDNYD